MPQPAHAARPLSDEELDDRAALWRTLLWDGAPSELVRGLARSRFSSLAEIDHPFIAALAASGVLPGIEDALELARRAQEEAHRLRVLRAVRDARGSGGRLVFTAEPGLVLCRLRPDLRELDHFGMTPAEAAAALEGLLKAAKEADELGGRRG